MARDERIRKKMIFLACLAIAMNIFFLYGGAQLHSIIFCCVLDAIFLGAGYLMLKTYEPADKVKG